MPTLALAPRAVLDLQRLADFLVENDPTACAKTISLIVSALNVLKDHPFIGRSVESGLRELVISKGKSGYLALYRCDEALDRVLVLAVRHQREAGFMGA
jgi:plasmid stabilization system protein ParE